MTEYEYKEKCQKINEHIKPSDEFVEKMKTNIEQELQNRQNKQKCKFPKIAASFIAITLLSTGAVAFADDIGNLFTKIFKNSDPSINLAIENGCIQNVDMDYIEYDGIGIKINSIIVDDNKIDVILDVRGEIDSEIFFKSISIKGKKNNGELNSNNLINLSTSYEMKQKSIDKLNHMLIIKFSNLEKNINQFNNMNIVLDTLSMYDSNNKIKEIQKKWEFSIKTDEKLFYANNSIKYFLKENKQIKKYQIELNDISMNLKIELAEDALSNSKINREDIIIKDEDNNEYNCKEFSRINEDMNVIEMNIPLTIYNKIDKFKIFINLENKVIELDVEKQKD